MYNLRETKSKSHQIIPRRSPRFATTVPEQKSSFLSPSLAKSKPFLGTKFQRPKYNSSGGKLISLNYKQQRSPVVKRRKRAEEVYRVSFPCKWGCPKCAFTSCLGPVRVYISRFSAPKEKYVREIADGRGQISFPKSRRKELRGLVYDKDTFSLFPPPPRDLKKDPMTNRQKIFY